MKKGLLLPVMLTVSLNCEAYEYFIDPVFNSNQRYNSNLYMQQKPLQSYWISTLSPALNFGLRHENGELHSNFTWNEIIYDNQSSLNIAEQLFNLSYQHKYQRFNYGITGSYNNQSSINSENTTSGLLFVQVMSKRTSLAPSLSYSIDELNTLSLNYSYNDATYGQSTGNIYLSNYTSQQASSSLSHIYSEHDTFTASVSGSLFETQPQSASIAKQTTHNYVGQLGWQHKFSEQLSGSISGGMNYSQAESQFQAAERQPVNFFGTIIYRDPTTGTFYPQQRFRTVSTQRNNFGQVFNASIQKAFEKGSVSLSAAQNQSPTAIGLQTIQSVSIGTSYTVHDRWSSGLSASYTKSDLAGQTNSSTNRTSYSVTPNINYKYTPEINVGLSYTYQQLQYQSSTEPSVGDIVQLNFSYQPKLNLR